MAKTTPTATTLGTMYLVRYYEGTLTAEQLLVVRQRGMITQAEYDRALAGEPPAGYEPPA